ncbi:cotranscriptional regulator ARB2A homolog [Lepisosteus oculatus]|uniref:cotranscriptional regulator ARB2A homolog n=1 Tax=Lepisosteus oculatus TaxID=7918 RepID=UPI0035F50362
MDECAEMTSGDAPPDFQYCFNQYGELRHRVSQEPFVFKYDKGDMESNQRQHRALQQCVTEHVYRLLEQECRLQKICIPVDAADRQGGGAFFMSPGALCQSKTLVVLIQDRGSIRAGQWSRRMIVRGNVERGSQIPYIRRALEGACEVVVMNPNDGTVEQARGGGGSPEAHVRYVWDHFVSPSAAGHVAVVAHGYGGLAFVDLLSRRPQAVRSRVYAVAFLDSCHSPWHQALDADSREWLRKHCRKWVLSAKPLDRPVGPLKVDCPQVSAGTEDREAAPWRCMGSVFRFFARALKAKTTVPFSRPAIITRSKSRREPPQA